MSDYSWCKFDNDEGRWVPVEASDVPMLKMLKEENSRMRKYVESAQANLTVAVDDKEIAELEARRLREASVDIEKLASEIQAKLSQITRQDDTANA